jgi:hypothetical protein
MSFHINHNPYIRRRIISFDSRFRDPVYPSPADFTYPLEFPIRNVISVRLSGIEYPNTYFVFSSVKGNTTMKIKFPMYSAVPELTATIADGNYTTIPGDPSSITFVVQAAIRAAYLPHVQPATPGKLPYDPAITVSVSPTTGHITIESNPTSPNLPISFTMDFRGGRFENRSYDWGLGYNLGFPNKVYSIAATSFTGSAILDIIGASYIFFQLDGIGPIQHYTPDKNVFSAFAKLVITGDKNSVVYDDGASYNTKEYRFQQPIDFFQIHPRLIDTYGELVEMNGKNYSFTLELEEITNVSAYRQYRDNFLSKPSDWQGTYAV